MKRVRVRVRVRSPVPTVRVRVRVRGVRVRVRGKKKDYISHNQTHIINSQAPKIGRTQGQAEYHTQIHTSNCHHHERDRAVAGPSIAPKPMQDLVDRPCESTRESPLVP